MKDIRSIMDGLVRKGQQYNQEAIVKTLSNLDRETKELVETVSCTCYRCGFEFMGASIRGKVLSSVRCPQCGENSSEKKPRPLRQAKMKECGKCKTEYLIYNDRLGCPSCGTVNLPDRNKERLVSFLKKESSE